MKWAAVLRFTRRGRAAVELFRAARDNRDMYVLRDAFLRQQHYAGRYWNADDLEVMRNQLARPDTMIAVPSSYPYVGRYIVTHRPRRTVRWPAAQWVKA